MISREFHVERRPGFVMVYPFTTYVTVFDKTDKPNLRKLNAYFRRLLRYGCPDYKEKRSVSKGRILMVEKEACDYALQPLAWSSDYEGLGDKQHEHLQDYLHANDPFTYSTEIPVWSEIGEDMELLHGHIDGVRHLPDDRVEVWDFKPGAEKETRASSQLLRYGHLLSLRTGISLSDIDLYYFDKNYAYKLVL